MMLHFMHSPGSAPRLTVLAYDIVSPRRARRVRRVLDSLRHHKQYSVYEVLLKQGQLRGLLAEVAALCDFDQDLLTSWRPRDGIRIAQQGQQTVVRSMPETNSATLGSAVHGASNFIICYDITAPHVLRHVACILAPQTTKIQRSVYWLRGYAGQVQKLLAACSGILGPKDRFWVYPLRGSHHLWHIGGTSLACIPMARYRWAIS